MGNESEQGRFFEKPIAIITKPSVIWTALGLLIAINLYTWLRYFQPAPFTDMVDVEWFLSRWSFAEDGLIPLITYPDNEHRAFLPILLQAMDHKLFASTGLFLILVHVLCFFTAAGAFARHAWLGAVSNPRVAHFAAGAMTLVMLWSAHWNNIIRTKQTHTCLALLFVSLAFWLGARFDARRSAGVSTLERQDWFALLALGVLVTGAVWSFTAGLAAIPVLMIFAFSRNWGWTARIILSAVSAINLGAWVWASAAGDAGVSSDAVGVFAHLHYGLNLLSGLFHHALAGDEVIAPIVGGLAFILSAPLLWFGLRERFRQRAGLSPEAGQAASFFTLALLWALVCIVSISLSRAEFGADQAFVSRYLPFGAVFAVSTVALALLFRNLLPQWTRRGVYGVTAFYLIAVVLVSPRGWLVAAEHNRQIALGGVAAALAIDDAQYTLFPNFNGGRLLEVAEDYRERRASFYRRDWGGWLDQPLSAASDNACAAISGEAALEPIGEGAYRVAARVDGAAPLWVAVLNGEGRVAGLARRGERFRTPPAPVLESPGYAGLARLETSESTQVFAVVGSAKGCLLESADGA